MKLKASIKYNVSIWAIKYSIPKKLKLNPKNSFNLDQLEKFTTTTKLTVPNKETKSINKNNLLCISVDIRACISVDTGIINVGKIIANTKIMYKLMNLIVLIICFFNTSSPLYILSIIFFNLAILF